MRVLRVSLVGLVIGGVCFACGSKYQTSSPEDAGPEDSGADVVQDVTVGYDGPSFGDGGFGETGPKLTLVSLALSPLAMTLVTDNGEGGSQQFTATGTYSDGSTGPVTGLSWKSDQPGIGSINQNGTFSATGTLGGTVDIIASYGTVSATTTLTVKLLYTVNTAHASTTIQAALQGATTPDPVVVWAYPYDQTVFPRGINESTLMWIGGTPTDEYYIHITAPTFELQAFVTAPAQQWDFSTSGWAQFLNSTLGPAEVTVARWDGTTATTLVDQTWIIANGSMRGTIYYEQYAVTNGTQFGTILRITPGKASYETFLDGGGLCTSCHTVSANGGTLVYNDGNWPPETSYSFDLTNQTGLYSGFTNTDAGASEWAMPALSADGTTLVENFAPLRGNLGETTGAFDPATGAQLTGTGLEGNQLWMPAFSPDNQLIVYVDPTTHDLRAYDWTAATQQAANDRLIVASDINPGAPQIQYPSVSPDHQWVVYQRSTALGSQGIPGDIYVASVFNPGQELALGNLDGVTYPFAAGNRDRHLNYAPSFAPVAAGGYFWIVFHSRRTYGNELVQAAYSQPGIGLKQLWVSAFDQAPTPGTDPSHPPFYLGGQSSQALNARAYWALSPCVGDGAPCQTGTDCCGGYCDGTSEAGALVCGKPSGCSQDGDKCTQTSDCCNAATGTTCINSVCSEPPPEPDSGPQ